MRKRIFFVSLHPMQRSILYILLTLLSIHGINARTRMDSVLINRVFNYRKTVDFNKFPDEISFYNRFYINKARRNPILWAVPSMYRIIRNSKREFAGETWNKFKPNSDNKYLLQVNVETASGVHSVMNTVQNFLRPDIYEVLMTQNGILSPFHRLNSSYYKYEVTRLSSQNAEISFRPYVYNTKLVRGSAIVDPETGRVLSVTFFGEFDMIRFSLSAIMGDDGPKSLFPKRCDIHSRFKFMGNLIETDHYSEYSLPTILPDSISERQDKTMMASLRPEPLPPHIAKLYHTKDSLDSIARTHEDTIKVEKKPNLAKLILWDSFADHLLNRTRFNLGKNDSYVRLDPLFNPLYFGYNNNKGVTYKIKLRLVYNLNENQEIYMQFKGGYAFKQNQFYFNVPFRWTYDRKREGYVELMVGNGNRISNSSVRERLQEINKDSIKTLDWDKLNLDYFKDFHVRGFAHHNLSDYFSAGLGFNFHRRTPVDYASFSQTESSTDYRSFAPFVELQFRPWGWNGIILSGSYERGIKNVAKSDMEYERIELDASWKKYLNPLRCLSMRLGTGFYTNRENTAYFLDYSNFNRDNIPGGWNDDWSGDFQVLNSHLYNSSKYYIRGNITYESPMLITYRLPLVGRFIESERIYVNVLKSTQVSPYIEYGYGFTNRIFSMGVFLGTHNWKYDGIGFQFGFELFNRW